MSQFGDLKLNWVEGENVEDIHFVDNSVIVFRSGNYIKFHDTFSKQTFSYASPGEGVGVLTADPKSNLVAFSEVYPQPRIFIHSFSRFEQKAVLKDNLDAGAELEYTALAFSYEGPYLASYSGVGDFNIIIWNYQNQQILCKNNVGREAISHLSFNPINWRQVVSGNDHSVTFWNIERSNQRHFINPKSFNLVLDDVPVEEAEFKEAESHPDYEQLKYIASHELIEGAVNEKEFEEQKNSVVPLCHVWLPSGHLLIGCKKGEVVRIDAETHESEVFHHIDIGEDETLDCAINSILSHKNGIYVATELGQILCLDFNTKSGSPKLISQLNTSQNIISGNFSLYYDKIVYRTKQGAIMLFQPASNSFEFYENYHHGKFYFALPIYPGTDMVATVREDSTFQIWTIDVHKLVGSLSLGSETITALECSPTSEVVLFGTESGYVYVISVVSTGSPQIVDKKHVSNTPISSIKFSVDGSCFIVGCSENSVWLFDGSVGSQIETIGYLTVKGTVHEMDSIKLNNEVTRFIITSNPYPDDPNTSYGHYRYTQIDITPAILKKDNSIYESAKGDIKESAFNIIRMNMGTVNFGCQITPDKHLLFGTHKKPIHALKLIEEYPKKPSEKIAPVKPAYTLPHHGVIQALCLSLNKKWLATGSADGTIRVGALENNLDDNNSVLKVAFHIECGGVKSISLSPDAKYLFCLGHDGVFASYKIMPSGRHKQVQNECASALKEFLSSNLSFTKRENEALTSRQGQGEMQVKIDNADSFSQNDSDFYRVPLPILSSDPTCKELAEVEGIKEEDKSYEPMKREILAEIQHLRKQHEAMIESNEKAPDIEKLDRAEFVLDTDEYARIKNESDAQVSKAYEAIELENLAKMYVRSVLKQECWDNMTVKGKSLKSFGKNLVVSNFPMKSQSDEELAELEYVKKIRKVEIADSKASKLDKKEEDEEEVLEEGDSDQAGGMLCATDGSLSSKFGANNEFFYNQFELYSKEQKMNQIVLLKDSINTLKNIFNKEFDDTFRTKEQEMNRVNERNKRITKILHDLNLQEDIKNVDWSLEEKPEENLKVHDSEIKSERFLTPEMRARLEAEKELEEQRRLAAMQDNWRDRGLDKMMGGVLEIRKEDELKKDVPIPAFMQSGKPEAEYTAEEKAVKAEYERKVVELNEEREKFYKQLEAELRKLQQTNLESEQNFDDVLLQLFNKKVQIETAVFHQELKILRIQSSLLLEEELEREEQSILKDLEDVKEEKLKAIANQRVANNELADFKEKYENIVAEDRVLDRNFRKEFSECSAPMVDALQKQYKRRPRGPKALKKDVGLNDASGNPYSERPSSALAHQQTQEGLFKALEEFESENYAPEGIDLAIWKRLCDYRRRKVQSEQEIKMRAQRMAEMDAFLKRRADDERNVSEKIDQLQSHLQRVRDEKNELMLDLEVQLLMRQGQVEVEATDDFIHNFSDSILVHRGVVEDLNKKIGSLGDKKIESMNESKEFRKGIYQLEWERKKMIMEIEDLLQKAKDIQRLKVTKELQFYLNDEDDDDKKSEKKAKEIATLEKTISSTLEQHNKRLETKKEEVKKLRKKMKAKERENSNLDDKILEMTVTVAERELIQQSTVGAAEQSPSEETRMKEIVQRRKLVDLAKNQAQEVAVLRAEVERLRMRTFPALVQIE